MDERAALARLAERLPAAGDDAAVVGDLVVTTDMLHASTDFPEGVTRYTAGWRAVGASLSDIAAMGADAEAAVAVYGAPTFESDDLDGFVDGAVDVCEVVRAAYVGGDLDHHDEFTVASTAVGRTDAPVYRSGATPGDVICVTGTFGRTAAALRRFAAGETAAGNELFRFEPRVAVGQALAPYATAMLDSSDGLARSLHQLATASDCGVAVRSESVPVDQALTRVAGGEEEAFGLATTVGEDFELVLAVGPDEVETAREACPVPLSVMGEAVDEGVTMDGAPLADEGYTH